MHFLKAAVASLPLQGGAWRETGKILATCGTWRQRLAKRITPHTVRG